MLTLRLRSPSGVPGHEPLLRRNTATGVLSLTTQHLADRLADLLTVAELISPNLHDYIRATSSVRDKLSDLPL